MKTIFNNSYDVMIHLKKSFPNLDSIPVAAFGISHVYYEDNTDKNKIAETVYTGSGLQVKLRMINN